MYSRHNQQGVTYIELMIVVLILAVISVIAIPESSSNNHRKLDLAAEEVTQAIRFARIEAMRTSTPYGVFFKTSTEEVKIYRLVAETPTYDVYHPIDKKIYTLNLKIDRATEGVEIVSHSIQYQGVTGNKEYIGFNMHGNPKFFDAGIDHMLINAASITLSYAGQNRIINVSPMIGRVTTQ